MSNILSYNPERELLQEIQKEISVDNTIHIRIFQRNARKTVTTVENIPSSFNKKLLIDAWKKLYNTSAHIKDNVIHLSGDHRKEVVEWIKVELDHHDILVHGY